MASAKPHQEYNPRLHIGVHTKNQLLLKNKKSPLGKIALSQGGDHIGAD